MSWQLALVLLAIPSFAHGHGSEYLGAKLSWTASGAAQLEIYADYGDNPLLADEGSARTALTQSLEIETQIGWQPLQDLAQFTWEKRDQPDISSPLPTDETGKPHQILTARWTWSPRSGLNELRFRGHPLLIQSLVFWLYEPGTAPETTRWAILLNGDVTPPISIPRPSFPLFRNSVLAGLCLLLGICALLLAKRSRR